MKATTTAGPQNEHPPLARDAQGNLLPIPEGTAAWRICRHTKGRPRIINGADKQPARFPLDTTAEELADACGADTYRVYALDDVGNVLDYVTTVETGRELRNAAESDVALVPALRAPTASSDLRFALEAITQIAKTNAEAMRAVADSQADWIKSISSARGFFRNAPAIQLPAPEPPVDDDHDEDEEEDNRRPDWVETIQPIVGLVVQQLVTSLMSGKKATATGEPSSSGWQIADMFDWRRAGRKRAEAQLAAEATPPSPPGPIDPAALQQALAGKAIAVAQLLEPDERQRLMRLAPKLSQLAADPEIAKILAELVAMSPDDAAAWVRAHLDEIERGLAS